MVARKSRIRLLLLSQKAIEMCPGEKGGDKDG